jgi:hypothetical protein
MAAIEVRWLNGAVANVERLFFHNHAPIKALAETLAVNCAERLGDDLAIFPISIHAANVLHT